MKDCPECERDAFLADKRCGFQDWEADPEFGICHRPVVGSCCWDVGVAGYEASKYNWACAECKEKYEDRGTR